MTAAAADFTGDGWIDIYVACDSTPSILYRNNKDGTFTDVAVESGTAYNEDGNAQAGMGIAAGDYNTDGLLDLVKTHFADDIPALYRNLGKGLFEDAATAAGLNVQNRYVEWGSLSAPRPAHRVPQCGRRAVRGGDRRERQRRDHPALEPRRRLRRYRQRRRCRRGRHEHERAAVTAA
jgi:hypothetical protein